MNYAAHRTTIYYTLHISSSHTPYAGSEAITVVGKNQEYLELIEESVTASVSNSS